MWQRNRRKMDPATKLAQCWHSHSPPGPFITVYTSQFQYKTTPSKQQQKALQPASEIGTLRFNAVPISISPIYLCKFLAIITFSYCTFAVWSKEADAIWLPVLEKTQHFTCVEWPWRVSSTQKHDKSHNYKRRETINFGNPGRQILRLKQWGMLYGVAYQLQ